MIYFFIWTYNPYPIAKIDNVIAADNTNGTIKSWCISLNARIHAINKQIEIAMQRSTTPTLAPKPDKIAFLDILKATINGINPMIPKQKPSRIENNMLNLSKSNCPN